jgi:hypothetical protein
VAAAKVARGAAKVRAATAAAATAVAMAAVALAAAVLAPHPEASTGRSGNNSTSLHTSS